MRTAAYVRRSRRAPDRRAPRSVDVPRAGPAAFSLAAVPAHPSAEAGPPVSHPGDPAEREADRAADRAMRGDRIRIAAPAIPAGGQAGTAGGAPPAVGSALSTPGAPLDPAVRAEFEPLFDRSFADVRVHADGGAAGAARAIEARAFTLGRHIGFSAGEYAPATPAGRHRLAHELAHVAQQPAGAAPGIVHRQPYHTSKVAMGRSALVTMAGESYWLARAQERFDVTGQSTRMANDRQEQNAVLATLLARSPPASLPAEQIVSVQPPPPAAGARGAAPPALIYRFRFSRPATPGAKTGFSADFVRTANRSDPAPAPLPADYLTRTFWDFKLDELRAPSRAAADRLGAVNMPRGLPEAEREAIGYAVLGYFGNGGARNTEIDAIIPLGAAPRTLMVTLRFGANNDVDVQRIGEPGTGAGKVDVNRIDVMRVNGFPGARAPDATLRSWWNKRYPTGGTLTTPVPAPPATPPPTGGRPPAPAVPNNTALIGEMNGLIARGSATSAWFQGNYRIEVMTGANARTLLTSLDPDRAALVADTRNFTPAELASLEVALQLLGDAELAHLSGVKVARKTAGVRMVGGKWEAASVDGLTIQPGTDRIILYFDSIKAADPVLFRGGGAKSALPASALPTVHEFGHIIEKRAGIEAAFAAWEKANPQTAPTDYAARARGNELFAEFYGLFRTDPRFLCTTAPLVFAWFTELARTGQPPAAGAALAAPPPGSCPP